jgi:pyruvate dehydrogenase E2 component (dihydrolipoamide acetyltransferase)
MARQMARTLEVPQFCLFADVPFVALERTRKKLAKDIGSRISVTDILARAVAVTLVRHPELNAHWADGEIIEYETVNIGLGVDTPNGLIVPVLAGAERLAIADVALRTTALIASARASMLRPEDVSGATFTISNLGMMGISAFQAVVNPPQVAILSAGAGHGDPGKTTTLGLSADHRAVDGAQGARFLQSLREVIEAADARVLAGG